MDEKILQGYFYKLRSAIGGDRFGCAEIKEDVAGPILNAIFAAGARAQKAGCREAVEGALNKLQKAYEGDGREFAIATICKGNALSAIDGRG